MFNDALDIEEVATLDSVDEVNVRLQDGWQLLGFHAAPQVGTSAAGQTIFVMGRVAEYDDDFEDIDLDLDALEALPGTP